MTAFQLPGSSAQGYLHPLPREGNLPNPRAGGVKDGVRYGCSSRYAGRLSGPNSRLIRADASDNGSTAVDTVKSTVSTSSIEKFNRKRELSKRQALAKTLQILSDNPTANPAEIADQIGKSRQTVYDYFDELEATGKLHRNGSVNVTVDPDILT